MSGGSLDDRFERGDPQGVLLPSFFYASRWHEDVSRSSSPVLLEWDEVTHWRFCLTVSVSPEKFQFLEKGQNRNFGYKTVISVKNLEFSL